MERVKRVTVPAWIHARSRRPGLCMPGALRREPTRSTCPIGMELFRVPASCGRFGWWGKWMALAGRLIEFVPGLPDNLKGADHMFPS